LKGWLVWACEVIGRGGRSAESIPNEPILAVKLKWGWVFSRRQTKPFGLVV
jgi:hypothetical protein